MGKTNQPLRLLVHPTLADHPSIVALVEKGHIVHSDPTPGLEYFDGIIGPNCWRMDESLMEEGLLEVALKALRAAKKKTEKIHVRK